MKETNKTKKQLIDELEHLRQRIAEVETVEKKQRHTEKQLKESEEKLTTIVENVNDVIFQLSPSGIIMYVSPKVEEVYGYKPEELIGKHLEKTTPVSDVPNALDALKSALSGMTIKNLVINQKNSDGKISPMEINITPVKKRGRIVAVQGIMRDIKERRETEEALRESAAKNRSLLVAIPDLIFRLNKKGVFLELIPAKEFSLWKPPSGFLGKNIHEVFSEDIAKNFKRCVNQASKTGETQIFQYQLMFNGKTYHHEARIVAFGKEVLAIVRDYTKQIEAEKMAETDPLTDIYNRRKFSQLLDQEIDRVERYNRSLAVILLDIDHFKRINDTFGHDAGDSVLKKISRLIRENIRSVDTLARYGGEEFVIILPETTLKKAMTAAERIRRVIERKSFDRVGHITVSAGVSIFEEGDNKQSIVKKADRGLYVAKREGRNRVSIL
jgi:diguanylate cyclase (GGDEF)-like protein/PAS domain S-box-containing protein